jgi:hypothetical protein
MMVGMTARGGEWERLDAVAVTPATARAPGAVSPDASRRGRPFRLKRSRGPVLAALDGGGTVFQRRLRDVMIGATAILVPTVALNVWVTILGYDRLDPNDSALPSFLGDDTGSGIEDVAVWLAAVFASFVTAVVGYFAAVILLGDRFRTPVTLGRALARTVRRVPSIFAAWALTHWWFPLMALIVVTAQPDIVAVWIFLFTFMCWFSAAATLLVIPAMVGERLGPFAAARRSFRLARLRYGVCLVFVLFSTLLAVLLGVGIGTLVPLLEATGFITLGDVTPIVQGVMTQLVVLVVVPLIALATAQVYVEVRVVGEGLDLVVDADAAFGPAGA